MRKFFQFTLFLLFFFLGFLALNYVIFYGISSIFGLPQNSIYFILMLVVALSYPIAFSLERIFSNILTRAFYTLSAAWLGISIYIIISLVLYSIFLFSSGFFIKITSFIFGEFAIAVSLLVSAYAIINATRLEVKEVDVSLTGLENSIRAVQLSDVHVGPIINRRFMERIVNKTNQIKPDIVFITGDLFDGTSKLHNYIIEALNNLNAPTLFVTGNHDANQGLDEVFKILSQTKIKILRNEVCQFRDLQVVGVDYSIARDHLEKTLQGIEFDKTKPALLMYHLPQEFKAAKDAGIDLQLSGHTHDGQFFPFKYLVKLMFPYIGGLYEYQGAYLYVSQGTGTWGPPMRLGSRCEITLIDLKGQ